MCKPARLAMTLKSTMWFLAGFIFLFGSAFFLALAARASPGDTLYVQSQSVNIYEAPNANAPVVMQINQGQKLKEFRRQGGWVKVIIYGQLGKEGWIEDSRIGVKPLADTITESQEPEEDTIVGAIEAPKPESLLHKFVLRVIGSGKIKGHCRYKTANGAVKRFKVFIVLNKSYQIEAKAIRCDVSSPSLRARLTIELWGDGNLLDSKTIRARAITIRCDLSGPQELGLSRTCARSTRRQLSAYW